MTYSERDLVVWHEPEDTSKLHLGRLNASMRTMSGERAWSLRDENAQIRVVREKYMLAVVPTPPAPE